MTRDKWRHSTSDIKDIFVLLLLMIAVALMTSYLAALVINPGRDEATLKILISPRRGIMTFFISPLLEELIFRKALPENMIKCGFSGLQGIFFSNLIFAVLHLQIIWIPHFINGLSCSYIYQKKGRIHTAIFLHSLYNIIAFVININLSSIVS